MKLSGYFTGFSSKADGSAGLRFSTQELSADDFAELKRELNEFGWILFKANEKDPPDAPKVDAEKLGKTPSERLRAILFVEWKQKKVEGDFEGYYARRMDAICEKLKAQLDN